MNSEKEDLNFEPVKPTGTRWWHLPHWKYRMFRHLTVCYAFICMGIYNEVLGPTMTDLKDKYGVTYEALSAAQSLGGIGGFLGAFVSGLLLDRFPKYTDIFIGIAFLSNTFSTALIPWGPHVSFVGVMLNFNGFMGGIINTAGNIAMFKLWEDFTPPFMHMLHFSYGIGSFLAPQIARPFLSPEVVNDTDKYGTYQYFQYRQLMAANSTVPPTEEPPLQVEIPFFIIGGILISASLLHFVMFFVGPPKTFPKPPPPKKNSDLCNPKTCIQGSMVMGMSLLGLLFLYFFLIAAPERIMGRFIFTYAVESDLKLSKNVAANLNSVFWLSFTLSRVFGAFVANFISVKIFIIIDVIGTFVCMVILAIFGHVQVTVLWVFTVLSGVFIAGVYPNGMAWANIYLDVSGMAAMVLVIGGSGGSTLFSYIPGFLIDGFGSETIFILGSIVAFLTIIVFAILQILGSIQGTRFKVLMKAEQNNEDKAEPYIYEREVSLEDEKLQTKL